MSYRPILKIKAFLNEKRGRKLEVFLEKIKKIYKSDNFPIYFYVLIVAMIHITVKLEGDDVWFSTCCQNTGFLEYMINRYQEWSSRVIIEICFVLFCEYLPLYIWKILNIGMIYLFVYSLSTLFIEKDKRKMNTIMCILLLCIPFNILKETGWVATMNCYLWTAATALYSIIPLKKVIKNEKVSVFQIIFSLLTTLYAANQEQAAGLLFIIYSLGILYALKIKKIKITKRQMCVFINYAIVILWLLVILTCPGNANRKIQEENRWFPGFSDLSLIHKVALGITSMMNYMIEGGRLVFFILIILLAYMIYRDRNKISTVQKILGYSPIIFTFLYKYVYMSLVLTNTNEILQMKAFTIFKVLMYVLILLSIGVSIVVIFKKENCFLPIVIYGCGVVSRMVMSFSPTIYASGERTSFFLYVSFVMLEILMIQKIYDYKKEEIKLLN